MKVTDFPLVNILGLKQVDVKLLFSKREFFDVL